MAQDGSKGFFASLFDFNFTSFITLKFLKVIYIILMVLILLGGVIFFFTSLATGDAGGVLVALFVVPAVTLIYIVFTRIYLEVLALLFRIGENTQAIRQSLGGSAGGFNAYPAPAYEPPAAPQTPPGGAPSWLNQPQQPQQPQQEPPSSPPGFPPQ